MTTSKRSILHYEVARVYKEKGELALISVGGVLSQQHLHQRINAGADLVQVHNGLIYRAPDLIKFRSKL